MSRINITNLTFAYDGSYDNIFENVTFQVDTNWKLGFIGRNGKGKTTFLKLLLGKYKYSGNIAADANFEYFPYEVVDKTQDTLDVVSSICCDYMEWELYRELNLLEVDEGILYRPFETLSNGEQTKVLLAALFLKENHFLLIDEPTNHLDMKGRQIVSNYLNKKHGFILVSHDRAFLDDCVDHILSINKAEIAIQRGNFTSWQINKELQDHFELAENEKLQKEIKRLTKAAKRTSDWSDKVEKTKNGTKTGGLKVDKGYVGHMAAKMMQRSKSIEGRRQSAVEEKTKLLKNIEYAESLKITPLKYHTEKLVELMGVSINYGEKSVCKDVSFTIEQGECVAIQGKNGSGKSSIIKLICGELMAYTGSLRISNKLKISYVTQDTSFLRGSFKEYINASGIDETLFKTILRKLDFQRLQFEKDLSALSSGQKKKVLIARSLCEQAHLYIWDEPLNFIDVLSRMQIEELLLEYKPTILFVEHDRAFCEGIATKVIEI